MSAISRFLFLFFSPILALLLASASEAQIRLVTYNTLDKPLNATAESQMTTIMDAIGMNSFNGIAKRVDILSLQEGLNFGSNDTYQEIADLMNTLYGVSSYQTAVIDSGFDSIGYVYDSSTVDVLSSTLLGVGTRPGHRVQFRPVGYTNADADFYVYDVHLKAGQSDTVARFNEAVNLKADADALPNGENIIYTGDFNIYGSNEPAFLTLLGAGNGQGFDPLNEPAWPSGSNTRLLTQSTRTSSLGDGGATGGMDDRFDMQIVSGELLDGEGVSYIGPTSTGLGSLDHSYWAFGNDGAPGQFNQPINYTYTGRTQSSTVLDALHDFSDHLPVVADYQIPAVMQANLVAAAPSQVTVNDSIDIDVLVENIANVVHGNGADELDYDINVSGDLILSGGTINDSTMALSGGNTHQVSLDTSTAGSKSGTISVTTSSLAAQNTLIEIDVDFDVFLEADFFKDFSVDEIDLGFWFSGYGVNDLGDADGDGETNGLDYLIWQQQFGQTAAITVNTEAVPEPTSLVLICSLTLLTNSCRVRSSRMSSLCV